MTQHDCLPSLLGDGDKRSEIVYDEEKLILYRADYSNQGRTKISCAITTSQPRKDPCLFVLLEFPYPSVLTVSRGRPPLSNLSVLDLGKNELRRSSQDWNIFCAIAYGDDEESYKMATWSIQLL